MMEYTCTQEVEAGGSEVHGHPYLNTISRTKFLSSHQGLASAVKETKRGFLMVNGSL